MVKAPRTIPDAVRDAQARASDPAASAFVSANAGSGKTHVLVQRVIRLLLAGVPPEKILCITFTKAAAANMAERVFTTLGHWVTLDDDALDAAIRDAGIAHPDRAAAQARRANCSPRALETPGGLKVQTIHALCTRLLQQFPFEANVPARFAVLDDRDQTEMMERASLARAARCLARRPTARSGARCMPRWRTPPTSPSRTSCARPASAATISWPGPTRPAAPMARRRRCRPRSASTADDRIEDVEREIVDGPHLPRSRWDADRARARRRQQVRPATRRHGLREALRVAGRGPGRRISRRVPDRRPRRRANRW